MGHSDRLHTCCDSQDIPRRGSAPGGIVDKVAIPAATSLEGVV